MDWIKKNLAEMLPFLFMMAASCLFFALSVADTDPLITSFDISCLVKY